MTRAASFFCAPRDVYEIGRRNSKANVTRMPWLWRAALVMALLLYVGAFVACLIQWPREVLGVLAGCAGAVGLMVRSAREAAAPMETCGQCGQCGGEHAGYPAGVCPFRAGLTGGPARRAL